MFTWFKSNMSLKRKAPGYAGYPTGTFELLGNRCIGKLNDGFHPPSLPMNLTIQTRLTRIVREWEVMGDHRGEFSFDFVLDETVSAKDLALERLEIYAENGLGGRGKLKLDGASQMTRIREHMGTPRETVFDLDMTQTGNAREFLKRGWSRPEANFCWSDAPSAQLVVPAPIVSDGRYELTIKCRPFLGASMLSQSMLVSLNEVPQDFTVDGKQLGFVSALYAAGALDDKPSVTMEFSFPDCARPSNDGKSTDNRLLGFAVKQITLAKLLPV